MPVAGHDPAGQPRADEPADAGRGEGESVLPGRESELTQQQHRQQRLRRHDQAADEHVVEPQRAQDGIGQDVPPAVNEVTGPDPALPGSSRHVVVAADRGDAQRREQVADGVGRDRRDRPEQADGRPAQRRADRERTPVRGLEPRVRDQQIVRSHEGLEVRPAGRVERDLGRGDHRRDDEQLDEAQQAVGVGDRDRRENPEAGQVHRDHHRPLTTEFHPWPERNRDQHPHRRPDRGQHRHLGRAGPQRQHRDQRERPERQPGAVGAGRVRRPQPSELPPQRPSRQPVDVHRCITSA